MTYPTARLAVDLPFAPAGTEAQVVAGGPMATVRLASRAGLFAVAWSNLDRVVVAPE